MHLDQPLGDLIRSADEEVGRIKIIGGDRLGVAASDPKLIFQVSQRRTGLGPSLVGARRDVGDARPDEGKRGRVAVSLAQCRGVGRIPFADAARLGDVDQQPVGQPYRTLDRGGCDRTDIDRSLRRLR